MADAGTSASPPAMPVTIHNCFWEDIPREEALARLERRSLDAETRRRIEDNIPELTRHYLTFEGRAFREYVEPNDRPAELLRAPMDGVVAVTKAIAPTEQGDCVFVLGEPIDRAALL